jgi:multiple sugar transport system permease protein
MREVSKNRYKLRNIFAAAGFLAPGLIMFLLFFLLPMLYSFKVSMFDWNTIRPEKSVFVGFLNYVDVIANPIFHRAILNTLVYTVITVCAQLFIGLFIAILLNQQIKGKTLFRVLYYLPVITSWVIVSLLFEYMFNGQAGLINYILVDVLHFSKNNIQWFADPVLAMVPINLLGIWKGVGWTAIIYLAGLQSVPSSLYEAAVVDGANKKNLFFKITLPSLRSITTFLVVVLTIGGLNAYISGLLMTNGGNPMDLTHFILTLMYEETFTNMNFGVGSAISVMLTVFIFIISIFQIKMLMKGDK